MTQKIDPRVQALIHYAQRSVIVGPTPELASNEQIQASGVGGRKMIEVARELTAALNAAAPAADDRQRTIDSLNQSIETWHEALGSSGAIVGGSDLDPVEQTFGEFAYNRLRAALAGGPADGEGNERQDAAPSAPETCPKCGGRGLITLRAGWMTDDIFCPMCGGTGSTGSTDADGGEG